MNRIIEMDCHGVILDVGSSLAKSKYGKLMTENGLSWDKAATYDFANFPAEVRKEIFAGLSAPEVIGATKLYRGGRQFLCRLDKLIKDTPYIVKLRTALAKDLWVYQQQLLEEILDNCGLSAEKWQIELTELKTDSTKEMCDCAIYIEDHPLNLLQSNASLRLLFDRPYNSETAYPDLKAFEYTRVSNYNMLYWSISAFIRGDHE